jgi:ssRNA-specific RNase YbeY (16S rRNA maturation enzyme)
LLGYDDLTPKDRAKMRKEEKRCLDHLSKHSLLIKSPNNIEKK